MSPHEAAPGCGPRTRPCARVGHPGRISVPSGTYIYMATRADRGLMTVQLGHLCSNACSNAGGRLWTQQHNSARRPRGSNTQQHAMDVAGRIEMKLARTSKPVVGAFATRISVGSFQIGGAFGGTARRRWAPGWPRRPILYSESGADERTDCPLTDMKNSSVLNSDPSQPANPPFPTCENAVHGAGLRRERSHGHQDEWASWARSSGWSGDWLQPPSGLPSGTGAWRPLGSRCLGRDSGTTAVGAPDRERIRRARVCRGCTHGSQPRRLPDVSPPAERGAVGDMGARGCAYAQRARELRLVE